MLPSVVLIEGPWERGSIAITRVVWRNVLNCSVHKYAGSRQPGISTSALLEETLLDSK
jgi:hypothetical protein